VRCEGRGKEVHGKGRNVYILAYGGRGEGGEREREREGAMSESIGERKDEKLEGGTRQVF
jgi:hypothetical protein